MNKFWYELIYNGKVINRFLYYRDLIKSYRCIRATLRPDERDLLTFEIKFTEGAL